MRRLLFVSSLLSFGVLVFACGSSDSQPAGSGEFGAAGGAVGASVGGTSSAAVGGSVGAVGGATSGGGNIGVGGGSAGVGPGGTASSGASGAGGTNASDVCTAYIACVAATTPQGLGAIITTYGATGSCWTEGDPMLCDQACMTGIVAAHEGFPTVDACNRCATSKDCPSALPACDTEAARCVTCLSNSDCKESAKPACDVATRTCVTCTENSDCKSEGNSVCNPKTLSCVGCLANSDCASGVDGTVCDTGTMKCRSCKTDPECAPGVCNEGNCVQCNSDAQCAAPKPRCGMNGACVACSMDSDCTNAVCNLNTGVCCGSSACTNQGLECGTAIAFNCGLAVVPCGDCPSGQDCVFNKCVTPGAKTCSDSTCSTGACAYVPANNDYECVEQHSSCNLSAMPEQNCSAGYFCDEYTDMTTGQKYDYCDRECLTDDDCPKPSTCKPIDTAPGIGTCQ